MTRSVPTLEDIQDIVDSMEERYRLVLEKFPQFSDIAPNLLLKGYMTCAENLAVLPDQAVFWKTVSYCRKIKQLKPYFLPVDEWDEERIQWMTRGAFFRILWIRIKVWLGILKD